MSGKSLVRVQWYFKLFNSIKEEHEVDLAELELLSLFGEVTRVHNFADIIQETHFRHFTDTTRVQDMFAHELPYGRWQGFFAETEDYCNISRLVQRLAYTREVFVAFEHNSPRSLLRDIFPTSSISQNAQIFEAGKWTLLRFITHQYFLEKSQYISKLSRNEEEVDANIDLLFSFLTKNLYRIPATVTMQVGKRLEDYFTIREEPSLYLTHYMHPYKGRFHPKMVRALLNYIYPKNKGVVMDNFAGCGTLLVEATLTGLDSVGIEINPLSVLMSNVKCQSLCLPPEELKESIKTYLKKLEENLLSHKKRLAGNRLLFPPHYDENTLSERKTEIPSKVQSMLKSPDAIDKILIAHDLVKKHPDGKMRDFLLLGLSGTVSDLVRRRQADFFEVLRDRLDDLYLRIYIFHRLNQVLKIELGCSNTFVGDTREMKMVQTDSIDAIVNSPPYSTALDYIKNDFAQLALLKLADIGQLGRNMIGNPKLSAYSTALFEEVTGHTKEYSRLPDEAKEIISVLRRFGRKKEALRTYKFFKDMYWALEEMYRVMKKGAKCAIIIGNNHYKLDDEYREVGNDKVLSQMALELGFSKDQWIVRELEKTRSGMIRHESILIFEKKWT
jgi:DNA modification methylase